MQVSFTVPYLQALAINPDTLAHAGALLSASPSNPCCWLNTHDNKLACAETFTNASSSNPCNHP